DTGAIPLVVPGAGATTPEYSPYLIQVANTNTDANYGPLLPLWDNNTGVPETPRVPAANAAPKAGYAFFHTANTTGTIGAPGTAAPLAITPGSTGYLLVGPKGTNNVLAPSVIDTRDTAIAKRAAADATVKPTPWYQTPDMEFDVNQTGTAWD